MNGPTLRKEITAHGRSLYARGLSPGTSGNISVRTHDGWLLTPTGSSLGMLAPDRLTQLDSRGQHVSGDLATKEIWLHLAMYEERPELNAIVHLHSVHSVAVSCLEDVDPDNVLPALTPYSVMHVGRLLLVPYNRPGSRALTEAVRLHARKSCALLLANHGPVVGDRSLDAAVAAIQEIEETARLMLLLRGLPVRLLSPGEVAQLTPPDQGHSTDSVRGHG